VKLLKSLILLRKKERLKKTKRTSKKGKDIDTSERRESEGEINPEEEEEFMTVSKEQPSDSDKYEVVEGTTNMGKYFNKNKKKKKDKKASSEEEEEETEEKKGKYIKKKIKDQDNLDKKPYIYYKPQRDKNAKVKPITRIGKKTEIGKLLEEYAFLRTNTFSLKNLDPEIKIDKKRALLLDLLNDKEQKTKMILWEAFCIWRGNVMEKYRKMAQVLKFMKQGSLKNLDKILLKKFAKMKNPRYYIIAMKKFVDHLFFDIEALKDAFSKWKKFVSDENLIYIKTKLLYAIYRNHKEDKLRNIITKYKDQKAADILKENNGEYPEDIKTLLEHYFKIWKSILPYDIKEILNGEKIVIDRSKLQQFKKNKFKDQIEEFERRVKAEEEALRRKYELKDNDIVIMDTKGNIVDIREWRNDPLKRVVTIRYRLEKYYKMKYFLKWYYTTRVMMAIDRLAPLIEGREKLINYMRYKPALLFFKLLKLNNPEMYLPKLNRLIKLLTKACPLIFDPYKTFMKGIILNNRINALNKLLDKIDAITSEYYLRLYLNKWKNNVNEIKEEKRKLLLSVIKKKINDEREITNNRKNELLKRILDRDNKRILHKFKQALKLWAFIAKVPFYVENGAITTIDGRAVTPDNVQELTENNILTSVLGQDVLAKIGDYIISTPEQKEEWLKEKLSKFIKRLEDKNKTLLRTKLYQWKSNVNYSQIIEGVKAIQRYVRRKLGHRLQKKRKEIVGKFIKKLVYRRINQVSKISQLDKILRKIYSFKKIIEKLKVYHKTKNQSDVLKVLVKKLDEKYKQILKKTYFQRWNNISEGIYNNEIDALTLIQATFRSYLMKKKVKGLLKRKALIKKFIKRKEHRCLLEYAFNKWNKNAMLVLCNESAIPIQRRFRQYYAMLKLKKLRDISDNYKNLCQALSHISGKPEEFFNKLKKIRKTKVLGDLAEKLGDKKRDNIKDAFDKLKSNNKLTLLENIITKTDDREHNKLKYYLDKWRRQVNKRHKIEDKIGALFDKKEEKEKLKLNLVLQRWLYNSQLIKYDINKIRIGFFCKKILYKLGKKKESIDAQKKWHKLSYQLLHGDVKADIKDILRQNKYAFGLKKLTQGINKKNKKNVLDKLLNNDKENKWVQKMKNIVDFMDKNNSTLSLKNYFKKWNKINKTINNKEKALQNALENLDYLSKLKRVKTLNDVFVNKKLFNTVKNVKSLVALRRLIALAKEDKKNTDLSNDLVKAHDEILKDLKTKFMAKLYKLYANKILDNFMKKLIKLQLKKALGPKSEFMNKLNLIALNDKEFGYKNINKIDIQPTIKKLHFKKKEKEVTDKDLLENKIKSNAIAFNAIIPDILDYINDICMKRKKDVYEILKIKARNEKFVKLLQSYINKKYSNEQHKLLDYLITNKRIQETEGPLQSELFKLLRKYVLYIMFNKDDIKELSRTLNIINVLKVTLIDKELSSDRWLRTLIRKWRFLAFSKSMSKKKLAYLYKHFHVNYLEMANNVFGEQDSNPSVIKEFERFGSNVGIWENEKPDFANQIKHAKTMGRRITFTAPSTFGRLLGKKDEEDKKEKKDVKEIKVESKKKKDDEEDEKEEKPKKIAKKGKKYSEEEEEEEEYENEENEEENEK